MTPSASPRFRARSVALFGVFALLGAAVGWLSMQEELLIRLQPWSARAVPFLSAAIALLLVGIWAGLLAGIPPARLAARRALSSADLQTPRFQLRETIPQQDILPFVQRYYLGERTWVVVGHYALSVLALLLLLAAAAAQHDGRPGPAAGVTWALVFSFVVVLPVHEFLHAAAYKAQGAPRVQFGGSWRKLYAYAIAPDFVIGRRDFLHVALLPSLAINGALLVLLVAAPALSTLWAPLLLIHISMAGGDWALLNYLWIHRRHDLYTYDTPSGGHSYFYEQIGDSAAGA